MTSRYDNYISKVRYSDDLKHIESVFAHKVNINGSPTEGFVAPRSKVISHIENRGTEICTIVYENGSWKLGDDVGVVKVNGEKWLRTDGNSTEKDNLGDLPEF